MGSLFRDTEPWLRRNPRLMLHDQWIQDRRPNGDFLWWHPGPQVPDWNLWHVFEIHWPVRVQGQIVRELDYTHRFSCMWYGYYAA